MSALEVIYGSLILVGLIALLCGREIYSCFDRGRWSSGSNPNPDAKVVHISSERVSYIKNGAKYKTIVEFSDGYWFITHKTKRTEHFGSYTISIDDELRQYIIEKAAAKHAVAVDKALAKK